MGVVVADTSALVSLGTVIEHPSSPLEVLIEQHRLVVPEQVVDELEETAAFADRSGRAATAVLDRRDALDVRETDLDGDFPLDDGENAAVTLANDLDATQLLCDEFNSLALVHASLADTRLVTTPTLLTALARTGLLESSVAEDLLSEMSDARSWDDNTYVARASETLRKTEE